MQGTRHSSKARDVLFWALVIIAGLSVLVLVQNKKHSLDTMWQYQRAQAETTYKTVVGNYYYFSLPNDTAKLLAMAPYQYTTSKGLWVLVNKANPLPLTYTPSNLEPVAIPHYDGEDIKVRAELNEPLKAMYAAAKKDGIALFVASGYRSSSDQQAIYNETASGYAAIPGQSEHQTGLAVDINSGSTNCGASCALSSVAATWLARHAADYGFIVRYQADKVAETGYPAEAWHLRYVGVPLAQALTRTNTSFDAAYPLFKTAKARQ